MKYSEEEARVMKSTARGRGAAIGKKAIVPRYVERNADETMKILDYGCGYGVHVGELKEKGLDVSGYDLDDEWPGYQAFDLVYCSNVLNVQHSGGGIEGVLGEVYSLLKQGGTAVINYPETPRYSGVGLVFVETILKEHFSEVTQVAGSNKAPVWKCTKRA